MNDTRTILMLALPSMMVNLLLTLGLIFSHIEQFKPVEQIEKPPIEGTQAFFNFYTRELDDVAANLREQVASLERRESHLKDEEARLNAEKEELERMRRELEAIRKEFTSTITRVEEAEVKNIKELAGIYTNMAPAEAVIIFGELEDDFVVKILKNMSTDQVASVLKEMADADKNREESLRRAARLSEMLRLTLVPEKKKS